MGRGKRAWERGNYTQRKKGWTLDLIKSFSRIHMVVNLWHALVWCWILTVGGSPSTRRSLCPIQHCTMLHSPYAWPWKSDAGWREEKPVLFPWFVSLESPFPGERHRPVKMTGFTQYIYNTYCVKPTVSNSCFALAKLLADFTWHTAYSMRSKEPAKHSSWREAGGISQFTQDNKCLEQYVTLNEI